MEAGEDNCRERGSSVREGEARERERVGKDDHTKVRIRKEKNGHNITRRKELRRERQ